MLFKLDGGIDHILIDEAQDTSPEQWRIVKALTAEFFAGAGRESRKGVTRTIFAVGDEKQSIFSFQGADPTQFDVNREFFRKAAEAAKRDFVVQPLLQSRRSVPEVLHFVDAVFAPEAARKGLTSDNVRSASRCASREGQGPRRILADGQARRFRKTKTLWAAAGRRRRRRTARWRVSRARSPIRSRA